jgi:hypothetical protein
MKLDAMVLQGGTSFQSQFLDDPSAQAVRERHLNIPAKMLNNRTIHVESLVQILLLFAQQY